MYAETIKRPPRTLREVFQGLPEGTLAQLIENNIIMSPSPLFRHQEVLNEINFQLQAFVKKEHLGQVLVAPLDVYLDKQNVFQPDILFVSKERLHLMEENGLHGAPDMVIEILSPSTAKNDLGIKKEVYERSGVKEYWVVDPATKSTHGFYLKADRFEEIAKEKNTLPSRLLAATFSF